MRRGFGAVLLLALTAGRAPDAAERPNVLLITIDTMRADRLGRANLTPALDALAARGTRFTRAYAHAPTTLPSHASMLTGLLPPSHGVRNNGAFRLDPAATTLAEVLRGAGYTTGAFVSAFVLDARYGLSQGFDVYDDRPPPGLPQASQTAFRFTERRAPETLTPATSWIRRQTGPWFAWVHLFDPHAPYRAVDDARRRSNNHPPQAYDSEVGYVDASLSRFFEHLGAALDGTIVVATADHGESLGEHGETTHGLFAYDATLHVPLILAGPGIASRVATETVSHIDLMPTVIELAGVGGLATADGRSLVPALRGSALTNRPVYFEALDAGLTRGWAPLTGVISEGWKYIDLPIAELYHLETDRAERSNRVAHEDARATRMRELARRIANASAVSTRAVALADADARERLRALGYAGSASSHLGSWRVDDDPKRLLPLHLRFQQAVELAGRSPDAAQRQMRALIDERPEFAAAYEAAATLLLESGRARDAITLLSQARSRGLRHRALAERFGAALLASGDARGAIAILENVAATAPDAVDVHHTLALALIAAGELTRARETLSAIVRLAPTDPGAWTNLGTLDLQRGAMEDARRAFERALDSNPGSVAAWKGLGASQETANPARAMEAWERAAGLAPGDYQLLARLAFLIAKSDPARAKPYLERLIREAPDARFGPDKRWARELLAQIKPN
ncbi:MAG: sulfatase-like hydrolase/transferase [Vicinamibacterales bacterium]